MKHLKITISTILLSLFVLSCSSDDDGGETNENPTNNSGSCSLNTIQGKVYSQVQLNGSNGININDITNTNLPILIEVTESTDLITENLRRFNEDENDRFFRIRAVRSFATNVNGFIDFSKLNPEEDYRSEDYRLGDCNLLARKDANNSSLINLAIDLLGCSPAANTFSNITQIIDKGDTIEIIQSCGLEQEPDAFLKDSIIYYLTDVKL